MFQFVYKIQFYQITVIISLRGRCVFTPGKHRFRSLILQIETIKVISIFTSSYSPFVNLCEVIRFSIRILTQFGIYPNVLFINLEEVKLGQCCDNMLIQSLELFLITFYPNISKFQELGTVSRISILVTFTIQYNPRLITHLTIPPM